MKRYVTKIVVFFLGINLAILSPTQADNHSSEISILPVVQQNQFWCWAAVSEMILEHFDYGSINPAGNFQCGIVAMLGSRCDINCFLCNVGIVNLHNLTIVLLNYQYYADMREVGGNQFDPQVRGRLTPSTLR